MTDIRGERFMENVKNELIQMFEDQEVKVKTDKGETLINLVHTAKCCGLVKNKKGIDYVRWTDKGVTDKLKKISSTTVELKYSEEIQYILDEIANTDDRNTIYMSSWLSKRLAMECSSEKAMKYKNFLATLDEKFSKGELMKIDANVQIANMVGAVMNQMLPTLIKELATQFIPIITEAKEQIGVMAGLMHDQSEIYDAEREELKELMGFKGVNTTRMVNTIKDNLSEKHGYKVMANDLKFLKVKKNVFKEFQVIKWEDIPVQNYNRVYAYIDTMDEVV